MAPRVGLEPTTYRLTAGRSTIELSGNKSLYDYTIIIINLTAFVNIYPVRSVATKMLPRPFHSGHS